MKIAAGTTLGRYEIRSQLGAGGMGEVYLAQDLRLERTVALKVLPDKLAHDKGRMRRFVLEARTASSLSHPNVAHIYEIEEVNGLNFIAMEYVDGETLRRRIGRSPLEVRDTLDIAMQIAAALSAAHAAGIAHRDIKPENVIVRRDGYVKVLDFGLAKLTDVPSTDTEAPTLAMVNTDPGTVMGTAAYMSPEQARAQPVDARTDIWSLGVVLYEMLTGHVPFAGTTTSDVIASILGKEPAPIARYSREVPDALEWIVTKTLTKDREERYQTAKELMVDLRRIKQRLDAQQEIDRSRAPTTAAVSASKDAAPTDLNHATIRETPQARAASGAAGVTTPTVSSAEYIVGEITRHKIGVVLVTLVLMAGLWAGGVWLYKLLAARKSPASATKFMRLTSGGRIGNERITGGAAISADGKRVAFWTVAENGKNSCYVRQVASNSVLRIVGPTEVEVGGVTFSPDGEFVFFNGNDKANPNGALFKVSVLGGTPQRVLEGIGSPITFSPDAKQIAYVRQVPATGESLLLAANADGSGMPRTLAVRKLPLVFSPDGPSWSPDGRVIALGGTSIIAGNVTSTVVEVPASGGKERDITPPQRTIVSRVAWLNDGKGLVMSRGSSYAAIRTQIWFISYPEGAARRITNDLNGYGTISLGVTTDSNTMVTVQEDMTRSIWVMPSNEDLSKARQISNGKYEGFALTTTPDGRILYIDQEAQANELWIMKNDGTAKTQLTTDGAVKLSAAVSPDGRYIVFSSNRSGTVSIWRMDLDGNNHKQLTEESTFADLPIVSSDGKWVVFQSLRTGNFTLWKVPIEGGAATQMSKRICVQPALSPDGKLLACASPDEKTSFNGNIAVFQFERGGPSNIPDIPLDRYPEGLKWTPDSRALTYLYASGSGYATNIVSQPINGGPLKVLVKSDERISAYDWTRDGKQLVLGRGPTVDDVVLIKDFK